MNWEVSENKESLLKLSYNKIIIRKNCENMIFLYYRYSPLNKGLLSYWCITYILSDVLHIFWSTNRYFVFCSLSQDKILSFKNNVRILVLMLLCQERVKMLWNFFNGAFLRYSLKPLPQTVEKLFPDSAGMRTCDTWYTNTIVRIIFQWLSGKKYFELSYPRRL